MNSVEEYARRSKHEKTILKLIETGLKVFDACYNLALSNKSAVRKYFTPLHLVVKT